MRWQEKYPGLYDEFSRWCIEASQKCGEPEVSRSEEAVRNAYEQWFLWSGNTVPFWSNAARTNIVMIPVPEHLISMRDMALI